MEITVREAAERLGVVPQSVRDMVRGGALVGRKVTLPGRSPLRPVMLVDAGSVERRLAERGTPGGARRVVDPEVRERMAAAGYLTVTQAAREIGLDPRQANTLTRLVKEGRVAGVREGITFIHRGEVERLRREREEKIAGVT